MNPLDFKFVHCIDYWRSDSWRAQRGVAWEPFLNSWLFSLIHFVLYIIQYEILSGLEIGMSWDNGLFRPGFPKTESFENPYNTQRLVGDFTPFYITIAICTVFFAIILILNIICCCSERYKSYWQDPHTGNRWILSIWVTSPKYQPPLDV